MDGYYPEAGVWIMVLVSEPPKSLQDVPIIRCRSVAAGAQLVL
jgi:hypothetical protein